MCATATLGHRHLIKDDVPVPIIETPGVKQHVLSDREAGDAIEYMKEMKKSHPDQPWYMQVWFNSPHGPLEVLHSGEEYYSAKYNKSAGYWSTVKCRDHENKLRPLYEQSSWMYKTLVSSMDKSLGSLLDAVRDLGIEEDTFIVFTSDNGPENGSGTGGIFREGKRSLMEGGVRVPTFFQWKGVIPPHSYCSFFGGLTDLLPTFLEVAGIDRPAGMRFDGISVLPVLKKALPITNGMNLYDAKYHISLNVPGENEIKQRLIADQVTFKHPFAPEPRTLNSSQSSDHPHRHHHMHDNLTNRVFLWHKDTDPFHAYDFRLQSGGYFDNVKVLTDSNRGCIDRIFDLRYDPFESTNLLRRPFSESHQCKMNFDNVNVGMLKTALSHLENHHCDGPSDKVSCNNHHIHRIIVRVMVILDKLIPFVRYGNKGHLNYMEKDVNKATCDIPVASRVLNFNYEVDQGCKTSKYGCSHPEY